MIKVKKLRENAIIPRRGREGDACFDLFTVGYAEVDQFETIVIPTGIAIELPKNYEAEIRPRSGISLKGVQGELLSGEKGLFECTIIQGTIDSNYRGEIGIIFKNETAHHFIIKEGTKLAQMKINEVPQIELLEVEELTDTNRGNKGFGSSGNY